MRIRTDNRFKKIVSFLNSIVSEGTFRVENNKLSFVGLDPANVCMAIVELELLESEGEGSFGVSFSNLAKILKRLKDDIIIEVSDKIRISCKNKSFEIPVIDLEKDNTKIPTLTYLNEFTIDYESLKEIIEDTNEFESVKFEANNGRLLVKAKNDKLLEYVNELINVDKKISENSTSLVSRDYLRNIPNVSKLKVYLKSDYPLMITNAYDDEFKVKYIIAPRIEVE